MTRRQSRHIGDDQLVYGLPKHMRGVSTKESLAEFMAGEKAQGKVEEKHYWTVHPKPKACEACQAMADEIYLEEPQRPHPNCKCEYKKHDIKDPTTEWAFDGKSLCIKGGPCFPCGSGPLGKGALPPGVYTITGNAVAISSDDVRYCDSNGHCWRGSHRAGF